MVLSIDDFYLSHDEQVALAASHPNNRLLQHRGQPGTHDLELGLNTLHSLRRCQRTRIPRYDKSAFNGQGDRVDPNTWIEVNPPVDVVFLEGWCVGFEPLSDEMLEAKRKEARWKTSEESMLSKHSVDDLRFVNDALRRYNPLMG